MKRSIRREARDPLIESMHQMHHGNEVSDFVIRGGPVRLETMLVGDCGGLVQVMPLR